VQLSVFESNEPAVGWGQIVPSAHIVQLYADGNVLLDSMRGFLDGGMNNGESPLVAATLEHLRGLRYRLGSANVDSTRAMFQDRDVPVDANVALARFVVNDRLDNRSFAEFVNHLRVRRRTH